MTDKIVAFQPVAEFGQERSDIATAIPNDAYRYLAAVVSGRSGTKLSRLAAVARALEKAAPRASIPTGASNRQKVSRRKMPVQGQPKSARARTRAVSRAGVMTSCRQGPCGLPLRMKCASGLVAAMS